MAFVCVECKKRFPEKKRTYENTDWCPRCITKESKRTSTGTNANGIPNLRTQLPGYMTRPRGP